MIYQQSLLECARVSYFFSLNDYCRRRRNQTHSVVAGYIRKPKNRWNNHQFQTSRRRLDDLPGRFWLRFNAEHDLLVNFVHKPRSFSGPKTGYLVFSTEWVTKIKVEKFSCLAKNNSLNIFFRTHGLTAIAYPIIPTSVVSEWPGDRFHCVCCCCCCCFCCYSCSCCCCCRCL